MADYGIIYAVTSGMIRRIVKSNDPNYDYALHVGPGESHVVANTKDGVSNDDVSAAVERNTGRKPLDFTCALVTAIGDIVGFIKACPFMDTHPEHTLVAVPPDVSHDAKYDHVARLFTVPEKIIPSGVGSDGKTRPETKIPEKIIPSLDIFAALASTSIVDAKP